ncbi:hypothetical protein TNCV_4056971 [Trichonephila clavipes]|nr:hypothetical protein TNCV_4056971 [Trichonephila clavipes]
MDDRGIPVLATPTEIVFRNGLADTAMNTKKDVPSPEDKEEKKDGSDSFLTSPPRFVLMQFISFAFFRFYF